MDPSAVKRCESAVRTAEVRLKAARQRVTENYPSALQQVRRKLLTPGPATGKGAIACNKGNKAAAPPPSCTIGTSTQATDPDPDPPNTHPNARPASPSPACTIGTSTQVTITRTLQAQT